MKKPFSIITIVIVVAGFLNSSIAENSKDNTIGFKVRVGGRYDNVRMCIASEAGAKGGLALEVSLYAETELSDNVNIAFDIPLFRPILFAAAFKMLQFDPDVSIQFKKEINSKRDLIVGPTVAFSLHYGPDYKSDKETRSESFWAFGPRIGGYLGIDFKRPNEKMNFQLGIHPYITPLFTLNTNIAENGIIAGATLDGIFKF